MGHKKVNSRRLVLPVIKSGTGRLEGVDMAGNDEMKSGDGIGNFEEMDSDTAKLVDFGSIFSRAVGTLGNNVQKLQYSYRKTHDMLLNTRELIEVSKFDIMKINDEQSRLKDEIRYIRKLCNDSVVSHQGSINTTNNNISSNNNNYSNNEAKITSGVETEKTRRNTQFLISDAKGKLSGDATDIVTKLSSMIVSQDHEPIPTYSNQGMPHPDTMKVIQKRLTQLEGAILMQNDVNNRIVHVVKNDTSSQIIIDSMNEQFSVLEKALQKTVEENKSLKTELLATKELIAKQDEKLNTLIEQIASKTGKRRKRGSSDAIDSDDSPNNFMIGPLGNYTIEESDLLAQRIKHLEDSLESSLNASNQALLNVKGDIDDVNTEALMIRNRLNEYIDSHKRFHDEEKEGSNKNTFKLIKPLKLQMTQLQDKLGYGLSLLEEELPQNEDEGTLFQTPFIQQINSFADSLDEIIIALGPKPTLDETLDVCLPILDQITLEMEIILEHDAKASSSTRHNLVSLRDIPQEAGEAKSLRRYIEEAYLASLPLLDERLDKIRIKRRVEKLENRVESKVETKKVDDIEHELRVLVNKKADHEEFISMVKQKASMKELLNVKDQLFKAIDLIRPVVQSTLPVVDPIAIAAAEAQIQAAASGASFSVSVNKSNNARPKTPGQRNSFVQQQVHENQPQQQGQTVSTVPAVTNSIQVATIYAESNSQTAETSKKLSMLLDQFKDLEKYCETLVPRQEVEDAMKAVLLEVRDIKINSVNVNTLRETLKFKADEKEMKKLIEAVTIAIGDLEGTNKAAGVHKCLVCDKPTSTISSRNEKLLMMDNQEKSHFNPGIYSRLGSPDKAERTKVAYDLAMLRNSIDLPPIQNDQLLSNSASMPLLQNGTDRPNTTNSYKQRIRSNAGGGFK